MAGNGKRSLSREGVLEVTSGLAVLLVLYKANAVSVETRDQLNSIECVRACVC